MAKKAAGKKKSKKGKKSGDASMRKQLSSLSDGWNLAIEGGGKLKEGMYKMQVQAAVLMASESSGKPMIRREHVVVGGEDDGTTVVDFMSLASEFGMSQIQKWLATMGYEVPEDPADLPDVLESVVADAPICQVTVKHQKDSDFLRLRTLKVLEGDEDEDEDEDESDEDEDEGDDEDEEEEEKPKKKSKKAKGKKKADEDEDEDEDEEEDEESEDEDEDEDEDSDEDEDEEEDEDEDEDEEEDDTAEIEAIASAFDVKLGKKWTRKSAAEKFAALEWDLDELEDTEQELLKKLEEEFEVEILPKAKKSKKAKGKKKVKK